MNKIYTSLYSRLLFSAVVSWLAILSFYFKPSGFFVISPTQIIDCTFFFFYYYFISLTVCVSVFESFLLLGFFAVQMESIELQGSQLSFRFSSLSISLEEQVVQIFCAFHMKQFLTAVPLAWPDTSTYQQGFALGRTVSDRPLTVVLTITSARFTLLVCCER